MFNVKKTREWENWQDFRLFVKKCGGRPILFIAPAFLAMIASIFEAVSIGLLIPTVKGIIQQDFGFVKGLPIFDRLITYFPAELENRNSVMFIFLVLSIFAAASLKCGFQYGANIATGFQVRRFANNIRKKVYKSYLSFNRKFFDAHSLGQLHETLVGHTSKIVMQMTRVQNAFYSFFSLGVYLVLMIIISWKLTLFVSLSFPVLHMSLRWLIRKISKTSEYFSETYLKLGAKISNALSCIQLVKAYTREKQEQSWFDHASDRITSIEISMDKKYLLIAPIQEMILLCMMLLLVGMMALLFVRQGQGEIAAYMVFVVVLRRSMGNLGAYNEIQSVLATIRGPVREVLNVIDGDQEYITKDGSRKLSELKEGIRFNNVCFSYRKGVHVLNNVSLSIEKGKMTAIVGATGAGKTTLTNLVMRFYDVSSGEILFDDVDIKEFTLESLRAKIAWVSQEIFLFNSSLRVNLTYGLDEKVPEEKINEAIVKARLHDFISRLPNGLETEVGDRGIRLSNGEKQRVAIARAILKDADILILDEATSSLDSKTEKLIQDALNEVLKGRTSIVIAHRLSTIKHADKIVDLENGQIVEVGKLEELLSKEGKFYSYWRQQNFF